MTGQRRTVIVSAALALLAGPARTAPSQAKAERADAKLDYLVGPGDVLQIFVWKEPELSRDVTVRLDGRMTLPLLGDVEAAGRTPQVLGDELTKSLARFLEAPRVSVGVSQANSSRFYVVGQVGKPGEFPLSGRTTFLQALAVAGGFRDFAKTDAILIVRQERGGQNVIPVNYKKIEDGKDIGQNILLRPGDTIVVP